MRTIRLGSIVWMLACIGLLGCDSVTAPAGDPAEEGDPTTLEDPSQEDTPDGDQDIETPEADDATDDGVGGEDPGDAGLTAEEVRAMAEDAARASVQAAATTVVVVAPLKDIPAYLQGSGSPPGCPALDAELTVDAVDISLTYGSGCRTAVHPEVTLTGAADGLLYFVNAVDLALSQVGTADAVYDGQVSGGFAAGSDAVTFALSVNLTLEDGRRLMGGINATVANEDGRITFTGLNLTLSDQEGDAFTVNVDEAAVDPAAGTLDPKSGTANVTCPNPDAGDETTTITLHLGD